MPVPTQVSDEFLGAITRWEGCKLRKYKDTAGKWTIGIGHLILPGENFDAGITLEKAYDLKRKDSVTAINHVRVACDGLHLEQHEFDALVSLVFNIGGGAFKSSTVLKRIKAGDKKGVPDAFRMWNKVSDGSGGHKVDPGLVNRREKEIAVWERQDYHHEPV